MYTCAEHPTSLDILYFIKISLIVKLSIQSETEIIMITRSTNSKRQSTATQRPSIYSYYRRYQNNIHTTCARTYQQWYTTAVTKQFIKR